MAFLRRGKYNTTPVRNLDGIQRDAEILELENTREAINAEIEYLLVEYKKLSGNRKAVRGARKIGRTKKDYSYWHKFY